MKMEKKVEIIKQILLNADFIGVIKDQIQYGTFY